MWNHSGTITKEHQNNSSLHISTTISKWEIDNKTTLTHIIICWDLNIFQAFLGIGSFPKPMSRCVSSMFPLRIFSTAWPANGSFPVSLFHSGFLSHLRESRPTILLEGSSPSLSLSLYILHVMNQEKNVQCIYVQELKEHEHEWRLKNIVIRKMKGESIETPASLGKVIEYIWGTPSWKTWCCLFGRKT